jgi:hypothetical protein
MRRKGSCPFCMDSALPGAARNEVEEWAEVFSPQEFWPMCKGRSAKNDRKIRCRLQIETLIIDTKDTPPL